VVAAQRDPLLPAVFSSDPFFRFAFLFFGIFGGPDCDRAVVVMGARWSGVDRVVGGSGLVAKTPAAPADREISSKTRTSVLVSKTVRSDFPISHFIFLNFFEDPFATAIERCDRGVG